MIACIHAQFWRTLFALLSSPKTPQRLAQLLWRRGRRWRIRSAPNRRHPRTEAAVVTQGQSVEKKKREKNEMTGNSMELMREISLMKLAALKSWRKPVESMDCVKQQKCAWKHGFYPQIDWGSCMFFPVILGLRNNLGLGNSWEWPICEAQNASVEKPSPRRQLLPRLISPKASLTHPLLSSYFMFLSFSSSNFVHVALLSWSWRKAPQKRIQSQQKWLRQLRLLL